MKKFLTVVSVALFIAACGDDSSSSVDLVLRPPPDESFNAEAVEDSTGAEISLSVMGTSFVCDRVTEDSPVLKMKIVFLYEPYPTNAKSLATCSGSLPVVFACFFLSLTKVFSSD